ncbi:MAG: hypothetical protein V3U89_03515 [Methylophilaceae bacterium]
MKETNAVSSNTQNAARLLAILGWLLFFIIGTVIASVLVVSYMGQEAERSTPLFWFTIIAIVCLGLILLMTANSLKRHRHWARYVGGFLAVVSLIAFPVGTVMGLFILSYLHKGWNEL